MDEMKIKILSLIEQIQDLDQKTRDKILLNAHMTESDFSRLKVEFKHYEVSGSFICDYCDEENIIS